MSAYSMSPSTPQEIQEVQKLRPFHEQPTAAQQQVTIQENINLAIRITSIENEIMILKNFFTVHTVPINTLSSDKWEFRKPPLHVSIEQRGPYEFIACLYDIDIYGYGDTIPEAIDDLKEAIINQIEFLLEQENSVKLGNMPKRQLDFLKKIMVQNNA